LAKYGLKYLFSDKEVREQMSEAIGQKFINPLDGYQVPDQFGMYSSHTNKRVKATLIKFLSAVEPKIGTSGLETSEERLNAFQDEDIESDNGYVL